jgi:transcriptional regulator with XRE-family HTH domain
MPKRGAPSEFIAWMRDELEKRRWSQAELGRRSDILASVINRWDRGEWAPNANSCLKIANAFGVEPQFVLEMAGHAPRQRTPESGKVRQLESAMRFIDWDKPGRWESVMGMLRMYQEEDTKLNRASRRDGKVAHAR